MEEAATQEGVGQLLFVVRGDDDDRAFARLDPLLRFVNVEAHPVEFLKQVVGKLDIGLVDLVDQQHGELGRGEGFPQLALLDVVADVVDALVAQLAVTQARHGVIFIEALLRLGGGLDVPLDQRGVQRLGDFMRQHGLAGAGLSLHQQRTAQHDGSIDRDLEILGGNIGLGAFKTLLGHKFSCETDFRVEAISNRLALRKRAGAGKSVRQQQDALGNGFKLAFVDCCHRIVPAQRQ